MHSFLPFSLFLLTIGVFASIALFARRASILLNGRDINALIASLEPVDAGGLASIAQDYLEPQPGQVSMEPALIWHLVGGELGLQRMRRNTSLLLALAAHASQWNDAEGMIVSERMRRDAIRMRTAVRQIRFGMLSQAVTGHHWTSVPFQLQEAASSYYLMRQRLLALFETSHAGLVPALAAAL